jgi:hypothetical protein
MHCKINIKWRIKGKGTSGIKYMTKNIEHS